jgi:D-alanine-D-alanine ligase
MQKVGLFFGGIGNEAGVSIVSAKNIIANFDHDKYQLVLCYWHKDSRFYVVKDMADLENLALAKKLEVSEFFATFDIALLMTHGRYGEDGVLQGILEAQKVKYCGCRVLSSALCMDKAIFKDLLSGKNIKQTAYKVIDYSISSEAEAVAIIAAAKREFKFPWYVKPANSGSSIGITKVEDAEDIENALALASGHDKKIIIEEGLVGPREIEVAVMGNEKLTISAPGELKLAKDFYDFDDKYKLGEARPVIPAEISAAETETIRQMAEKVYRLADCRGFARVDFFLYQREVYLNEINTLPGFTDISMFPMLMKNTGLTYQELINRIIDLAY